MNRTSASVFFLLFAGICLLLGSCKKYEDGPYLSFASRAKRIAGSWQVELAFNRNFLLENTEEYQGIVFQFTDGGTADITFPDEIGNTKMVTGSWSLEDNNETFQLMLSGDIEDFKYSEAPIFDILRLTGSDFWLVDEENVEIRLRPI